MIRLFWIAAIIYLMFGAPCRAEDSVKEAGKEIGQGFKKFGIETGKAFKEGGKEVGQGFKDFGKETGAAFKEGGREIGPAAKKTGRSVGDWFKDLGHSFKKAFGGE
jgi:hypothetical protein